MKTKRILILSLVIILAIMCAMVLFACNGVGSYKKQTDYQIDSDKCEHKWTVQETAPTCTNKGYKTTICELCGKIKSTEEIPVLGHDIIEHEGKAATCTEGGWKAYQTCTRCSYSTYQAISAIKHSAPEYVKYKPATCTEDGCTAYEECKYCHQVLNGEKSIIKALEHNLVKHERQDSTCTEIGWEEYYTCTRCDYTTYVEIPMHHYDDDGYCIDCGQAYCAEYLELELNDAETEYIVKGFKDNMPANVIIAAENKGKQITEIAMAAFDNCSGLESLTIGKNIKTIGNFAFRGCNNLTNINWNAIDCEEVGNSPYGFCLSLTTITIGDGVQSIPDKAFYECGCLTSLTIPDSVTSIGEKAFYACHNLKSISLPSGLTSIGEYAFEGSYFTSITIPENVTSIGKYAFKDCRSLTDVTIPANVTSIDKSAFYNCKELTTINWNAIDCDIIGTFTLKMFSSCPALTTIIVGDNVTRIPKLAWNGSNTIVYKEYDNACYLGNETNPYMMLIKAINESITTCTIHNDTKTISELAFSGCKNLSSITIPFGVTHISNGAFSGCSSLVQVDISSSVISIGDMAFNSCTALESITIPNSVTNMGKFIFSNCTQLSNVELSSNLTGIEESAFDQCYKLENITIPNSVTDIGDSAFFLSGLKSITIGTGLQRIRSNAFSICDNLTAVYISDLAAWCSIDFASSNSNPLSVAGNLYLNGVLVTDLVIPSTVTEISSYAFYNCQSIQSVTIPTNVKTIHPNAFYKSGVISATFENTSHWKATDDNYNYDVSLIDKKTAATNLTQFYRNCRWYVYE